jgi:hypothetical protein
MGVEGRTERAGGGSRSSIVACGMGQHWSHEVQSLRSAGRWEEGSWVVRRITLAKLWAEDGLTPRYFEAYFEWNSLAVSVVEVAMVPDTTILASLLG